MTPSEMAKIIRTVLCRGLSFEQTEHILRVMLPAQFEAGLPLYKEGDQAQGLVVLLSGTVDVMKAGAPEVLATIQGPAVFGEISLLTEVWWGLPMGSYSRTRAWSPDQMEAAKERMRGSGVLEGDAITDAGRKFREDIEVNTDWMMERVVDALGDDADELFGLLEP